MDRRLDQTPRGHRRRELSSHRTNSIGSPEDAADFHIATS